MEQDASVQATSRAALYMCLARAFGTPAGPQWGKALGELLPRDIEDLAGRLGLDIAEPLADFEAQAMRLDSGGDWLQIYSAIFLAPPVAARINAGWYLDGAINGGSVGALEQLYEAHGVRLAEGFADLPDHVSLQLEFASLLHGRAAEQPDDARAQLAPGRFLHDFAAGWIGGFCADLARAARAKELAANPYLPLALILRRAIAAHAVEPPVDARQVRRERALDRARARYAAQGITDEVVAEIRRKLEERGLATDHLPSAAQGVIA